MHQLRPLDTILILAILLIGIAQLYLIFGTGKTAAHDALSSSSLSRSGTSDDSAQSRAAAPGPPSNILTPVGGKVLRLEGSTLVVKGQSGKEQRITTSSATIIVKQGERKDQATIDADMEAFREQSNALAANPEKNHDALATLVAPFPFTETPVSLTSIHVGDVVSAFVVPGPSGHFSAVRLLVMPKQ